MKPEPTGTNSRVTTFLDDCHRLASETGVLLLPGPVFDLRDGYVRMGLGRLGVEPGLEILVHELDRKR